MNAFNELLGSIACLDFEPDKTVALLERIIAYRDFQIAQFDGLRFENERLTVALKEARKFAPAKVTIALGEICRMASGYDSLMIPFIKEVRNSDKLIITHTGEKADLRFVKEVCEAVAAVEGTGGTTQSRVDPSYTLTIHSPYNALRREVNFLAMQKYPNHQIEIIDE